MSIGSFAGILGTAAGVPRSQVAGSETEQTERSSSADRERQLTEQAEQAAGIGQMSEDSGASERDADGRRLWEESSTPSVKGGEADGALQQNRSKDCTGAAGRQLDLLG